MIGTGKPNTSASAANQAVLRTAMPNCGSARTRAKFSRPTNVGSDTKFVSCTLITNARRIGNQANSPKMTRNGSRKTNVPEALAGQAQAGDAAARRRVGRRRRRSLMEPMAPECRIPVGAGRGMVRHRHRLGETGDGAAVGPAEPGPT